jgi:hypothetical protein
MDKKNIWRKLFDVQTIYIIGIVIGIAIVIFCVVRIIGLNPRNPATVAIINPATGISQQTTKEGAYKMLFDCIEMAKSEMNYDNKLEKYSLVLLGYNSLVVRNVITCSDYEMPKLERAMRGLEAFLLILHERGAGAKKAPKLTPANFEKCENLPIEHKKSQKFENNFRRFDVPGSWEPLNPREVWPN